MKKTFKTLALMLLTALAFSSCADVPVPFNLPDKGGNSGGNSGTTIEPTGDGTLDSPYNVAAIVAKVNEMEAGVESTEEYYVIGKVLAVKTDQATITQYGNHTFTMVDEGTTSPVFTAFQVYGLGKKKFTSVDDIKVGDEVIVCGKVVNYRGNTPETVGKGAAYVVSINSSGGDDNPPVEGTEITCAQAVQLTNDLADGASSTETYSVTGYITEVVGAVSTDRGTPQQTFWMADTKDGGKVFEAYYANVPSGVSAFTVGMKVKLTGQLLKYVNKSGQVTPEIKNGNVVVLEDGGGDTPPVGDAIPVSCSEAVQLTQALADGGTSTETYAVTGYITETDGNVSTKTGPRQQVFWMADTKDGGKVFEAYWANVPDGVEKFTVGMKVTITGKLKKYVKSGVVTCEIQNADVVILEQGDGGETPPTPGPGGDEVTDLVNGNFEEWVSDSEPLGWKSASTASNATLSQSTEAHGGSYACLIAAPGTANKRLATQEITLEAGTYTFSFYAKSTTADVCQARAGYVPVSDDNAVGTYKYGDYVNINNNEWTLISYEFTLTGTTKLCLLVMNPKNSSYSTSQDILVDDATLVKQ